MNYTNPSKLQAAILDWAGTVVDFGSFAPTQIFVEAFAEFDVQVSIEEARGPMGMGKTAFTRGLVLALGGGDVVSSPTFALVNEYDARLTVQHFDMYRVSGWDDLYSTGFFDYLDTDNVLVIEWSENIDGALPENTIYVHMEKGETETERIITIEGIDL